MIRYMSGRTCTPHGLRPTAHVLHQNTSPQNPARSRCFLHLLPKLGLKAFDFFSPSDREQRGPHNESRYKTDNAVLRWLWGARLAPNSPAFLHDHLVDRSQPDCPPRQRIRQYSDISHSRLTSGCFDNDCFRFCFSFEGLSSCALWLKL